MTGVATAVAAALTAAADVTDVQRDTVMIHLRLRDIGTRNALDRISETAAVMTAAGVPHPAQVTVLRDGLGVTLGTGRTGRGKPGPPCGYCGARNGGIHPALCPGRKGHTAR